MQPTTVSVVNGWLVDHTLLKVRTEERIGLYNITQQVGEFVAKSGVREGIAIITSMHTTTAIFINEYQDALLRDIRQILEQMVREDAFYFHNCDDYSDCERKNATAHLRALLLGHQVIVPVQDGHPAIGTWQSIILAELDGPRTRTLHIQVMGKPGHK